MAITHVNSVANRLSLRKPQRDSLEILARLAEILKLHKDQDVAQALEIVKSEFNSVTDFERDFPSLCFALATGVGKTRLMGAFISYLHRAENIQHFFVLAPNLTIYRKLIADFTPNTPKYVFEGIGEFVTNPPVLITGDDYESGKGVRDDLARRPHTPMMFGLSPEGAIHINIFNVAKITSELRGGKEPRIKRLAEYIGESYFEYLSHLQDLVLIMDESHRYRADAGMRAINELKPILGLELTATPFVEKQKRVDFKNVIYSYPLAQALDDGFVKIPTVVTRQNFDPKAYAENDPELEKLKLKDGVHCHEETRVNLDLYARETGARRVKPFMLVIARDTDHAAKLKATIESDAFFAGQYRHKVITVHSNQKGEEAEETVEKLLAVESPDEPTEIVIHVNMLREGWDVSNLYTIVPLRAANSKTLVEQSIGRGLRLPYGKRTGVKEVDCLYIVAHDKFQEIVDQANDPNSLIRNHKIITEDESGERIVVDASKPVMVERAIEAVTQRLGPTIKVEPARVMTIIEATRKEMVEMARLPSTRDLPPETYREQLLARVQLSVAPAKNELQYPEDISVLRETVAETVDQRDQLTIEIPRITVTPKDTTQGRYQPFKLDLKTVRFQPIEEVIVVHDLHANVQSLLKGKAVAESEKRPEDYVVYGLVDKDGVSYDDYAELLYDLSGQVVSHLRSYLASEDLVVNVLRNHTRGLADVVYSQMEEHYREAVTEYAVTVSGGPTVLRDIGFSAIEGRAQEDFRVKPTDLSKIRKLAFAGFKRSLYPTQKFDSDPERRFAVILENPNDKTVLRWLRPYPGLLRIYTSRQETEYVPDFIVETIDHKYICEVKARNELVDLDVIDKARAATEWCKHATDHAKKAGSKPWTYALIPDDEIVENMSFAKLVAGR